MRTSLTSAPLRTRMVKRCRSSLAGALAGSALAFSRNIFRMSSAHSWKRFSLSSLGFSFARLPPPKAPSNSWAVMARIFGCSLSSPLRKISRIRPNWLAKVTISAWAGVTSKETVLPSGIDLVSGALGSADSVLVMSLTANTRMSCKMVLQRVSPTPRLGSARMKTCTSHREPGSTSPLWMASGPTVDGNHAEPLGNQAVGGHLAAGEELGIDDRLAGEDHLPRAAAVDVFLANHRPDGNAILGPLFEFDVVGVDERAGGNVRPWRHRPARCRSGLTNRRAWRAPG